MRNALIGGVKIKTKLKPIYLDVCALSRPFDDQDYLRIRLETEGGVKMRTIKYMAEDVVIKKAMEVLIKELGPMEAIRFINMPRRKRIESVRRHKEWQKLLNKDKFFDEVFTG